MVHNDVSYIHKLPFWEDRRVYSRSEAWIDILRCAGVKIMTEDIVSMKWTATTDQDGGKVVRTNVEWGKRWGWSEAKVRRFMQHLTEMALIISESVNNNTAIKVISDGIEVTEVNKEKPKTIKKFVPPTVEQVASYCAKRKNGIDAEAFVAFYASKGWKVGNTPMKRWEAAIITWEKRHHKEKNEKADAAQIHKAPAYKLWSAQ